MGGGKLDQTDANQNITPVTPPWLANAKSVTMPQAAPGQLAGLARDLANGGFGSKAGDMKYLDQIYSPVQTMQFGMPPKPTTPKPVTPPVNGGGGGTLPSVGGGSYQLVDGKFVKVGGGVGGANSR